MFQKEVYSKRRNALKNELKSGVVLLPGNQEAAFNYPANTYYFRQDSNFLYFFGLDHPNLAAVVDIDSGTDIIFGDELTIDDIMWMGELPTIKEQAASVGVTETRAFGKIADFLKDCIQSGRQIHFSPVYRGETQAQVADWLGLKFHAVNQYASLELIKAVVKLREIKDKYEIAEIEKAVDTAWLMHTTAMKMAKPGVIEQEIAGTIEGIALAHGGPVSFPVILSINGQILHNHNHKNKLTEGRMMVTDAGCETGLHYASDITRTTPVGGKFNSRQKSIYQIVLDANMRVQQLSKPGVFYRQMHLEAAKTIAKGLSELGIMKGNVDDAVAAGAHALFMPHGLGHMMGLDVHDMEGLGENFVGYNEEIKRSEQFGLAFLRLGKRLKPGFVITNEPGTYFIPALVRQWEAQKLHTDFINYAEVKKYLDFGGVRIEDDLLITDDGCRILGKEIPKTVEDIEKTANS